MKELSCYGGNGKTLLEDNPKARACPDCGRFTHPWEDIGDLKSRTIYHYNFTADGVPLISPKFRAMLDDFGVTNVEYRRLSSGYFAIRPTRQVFLDYSDCFVRIGEHCKTCSRPKHFLGHFWRARLLQGEQPVGPREIVRAALEVGGGTNLVIQVLIGDELAAHIKKQKFPKVYVYDIPRRIDSDEPPLKV